MFPPGWDRRWQELWELDATRSGLHSDGAEESESRSDHLAPARVTRIDKGGITISPRTGDERLVVAAKAVRRVVVGDIVGFDPETGRIEEILPRRTVFERRSPGVSRDQIQINSRALAANMDLVLILQPLDRGVNLPRLARELVLGWESGAEPVVVLTKADLLSEPQITVARREAQRFAPGSPVVCVSSRAVDGLAELEPFISPGSVAALLGASGAGKSSLINRLADRKVQLTADVREGDRRGRHTTTAGQMIGLANGALVIDTPGIRGVGLWECDKGLDRAFADLAEFADACRFMDCTHTTEPGCALIEAVESGTIAADRLDVLRELMSELDELEDGLDQMERRERRDRNQRSRNRARRRDTALDPD